MNVTTEVATRLASLRDQINHHDYRYHVLDSPEISDEQYDQLISELRTLEAAHPELVTPDSPTQRVGGAPVAGLATARHAHPMLSLDSSPRPEDLRAFDARLRRAITGIGGNAE